MEKADWKQSRNESISFWGAEKFRSYKEKLLEIEHESIYISACIAIFDKLLLKDIAYIKKNTSENNKPVSFDDALAKAGIHIQYDPQGKIRLRMLGTGEEFYLSELTTVFACLLYFDDDLLEIAFL